MSIREQIELYIGDKLDQETKEALFELFESEPEESMYPAPKPVRFAKWFEDASLGQIVELTEGLP